MDETVRKISADDINPRHNWGRALPALGPMGVDFGERDKLCRWALLARDGEPILWDFGSAAVHHRLYVPWLDPQNCKAGLIGLRGTVSPSFGLMKRHAEEIASLIREAGCEKMPVGVDIIEPPMMFELEKAGLKIADGQQVMLEAREIKNIDEIALLN